MSIRIGILGGIGPEATGEFYLKLIKRLQERRLIKNNMDFSQIIINSIPAPELIYEKMSEKDLEPYIIGLKELESFNVDFIVMVCNTIYLFYERLQKGVRVPIVDLRKELKNFLVKKNIKTAIVLSTPMAIKMGLYKFEGINSIDLDDKEMKLLTEAVFNFNKGFEKDKQIQIVRNIAKKYLSEGNKFIILGCTEIALMLKDEDIPKISTMDVLVESTIDKFIQQVRKS